MRMSVEKQYAHGLSTARRIGDKDGGYLSSREVGRIGPEMVECLYDRTNEV